MLFQDDGPGVPGDKITKVFEPFFSTKEGGTGLGLTVSYNIIAAHGGNLEVVSDQGEGACFRVFLPTGEMQ
jgi:signal transduction histidine kinase